MDSHDRSRQHALAIMVVGLQVSILGLSLGEILLVLAGVGLSFVVYFVNFWEGTRR